VAVFLAFAIIGAYNENARAKKATAEANHIAEIAENRAAELERVNKELGKANEEAIRNWQAAIAEKVRFADMQKQLSMGHGKTPIEFITDDARIMEEALSKDPARLRNILEKRPSRISFDVDMREIGSDPKLGTIYRFELFPRGEPSGGSTAWR
jgi:hypothetical protein